jgi:hypothetical protein
MLTEHMLQEELAHLRHELSFYIEYGDKLRDKLFIAEQALNLIAAPKRSDGTYNRCREACQTLAQEALKEIQIL